VRKLTKLTNAVNVVFSKSYPYDYGLILLMELIGQQLD
jgi:hypothetical protein